MFTCLEFFKRGNMKIQTDCYHDQSHPGDLFRPTLISSFKPHSHCAGVATVHPYAGQPVYRDAPGHIS